MKSLQKQDMERHLVTPWSLTTETLKRFVDKSLILLARPERFELPTFWFVEFRENPSRALPTTPDLVFQGLTRV